MAEKTIYESATVWDQQLQIGQRNLIQAICDHWPADIRTVLDIGCGDGKITHALAEHTGAMFHGFDGSREALSRLHLPSTQGDVRKLPFSDRAFDLVMTTDVFEHLPDDVEQAAWDELFRVAGDWVFFAVPFREELLDATARCSACGNHYHVNWHHRTYDYADLANRAPAGWTLAGTILSGEQWSPMLPPETAYRRAGLDEWSGWNEAVCPTCAAPGRPADPAAALPPDIARALGLYTYKLASTRRFIRSHSEIITAFNRGGQELTLRQTGRVDSEDVSPALWTSHMGIAENLDPYPQAARMVAAIDGGFVAQFPVYPGNLKRLRFSGRQTQTVTVSVEDGYGPLFSGEVTLDPEQPTKIELPRAVVGGYYGLLVRLPSSKPFESIFFEGNGPSISRVYPRGGECGYYTVPGTTTRVQVTHPLWLDHAALTSRTSLSADSSGASVVRAVIQLKHNLQDSDDFTKHASEQMLRFQVIAQEHSQAVHELDEFAKRAAEQAQQFDTITQDRNRAVYQNDELARQLAGQEQQLATVTQEKNRAIHTLDELGRQLAERVKQYEAVTQERGRVVDERDALVIKLSEQQKAIDAGTHDLYLLRKELVVTQTRCDKLQGDLERLGQRGEVRMGQWVRRGLGSNRKSKGA